MAYVDINELPRKVYSRLNSVPGMGKNLQLVDGLPGSHNEASQILSYMGSEMSFSLVGDDRGKFHIQVEIDFPKSLANSRKPTRENLERLISGTVKMGEKSIDPHIKKDYRKVVCAGEVVEYDCEGYAKLKVRYQLGEGKESHEKVFEAFWARFTHALSVVQKARSSQY